MQLYGLFMLFPQLENYIITKISTKLSLCISKAEQVMRSTELVHLLPLIYYVVTREQVTQRELAKLLGIAPSTTRKLLWSARRAKLVDYERAENSALLVKPTLKSLRLAESIEFFARRRNKIVLIAGGAIIYAVIRPRKGIRALPVPLDKLCQVYRYKREGEKSKAIATKLSLPAKTVSLLERVLTTMGCPSSSCLLDKMCKEPRDGDKE